LAIAAKVGASGLVESPGLFTTSGIRSTPLWQV
jgi:hypothetical protein